MLLHLLVKKKYLNFFKINIIVSVMFAFLYYLESKYYNYNKTLFDCMYFSLVTQTTVGYGDIITRDDGLVKYIVMIQLTTLLYLLQIHM